MEQEVGIIPTFTSIMRLVINNNIFPFFAPVRAFDTCIFGWHIIQIMGMKTIFFFVLVLLIITNNNSFF